MDMDKEGIEELRRIKILGQERDDLTTMDQSNGE
jgi:hypothetical protein